MQGILLAAGFGRRFQEESDSDQDKLLAVLPQQGSKQQTVLWHSAKALITALPNSMAVVQSPQIERKEILQSLGFIIIESVNAARGMGYAIADAIGASKNADGWLIALADMPWVSSELIQQVSAKIINPQSIAAPRFHGKRGQPIAFGSAWFEQLNALRGDTGARELLQTSPIDWVDWCDDSIHLDVDNQQDLTKI